MKNIYKVLMCTLVVFLLCACVKTSDVKDDIKDDETVNNEVDEEVIIEEEFEVFNEDDYLEEEEEEVVEEVEKPKKDTTTTTTPTKPSNKYYIKVNCTTNVVTIYTYDENYEFTKPIKAMVCSTGKNYCTPTGTFKMSSKHRWQLMNGDVYSQYASRITGHILFHSVPYAKASNDTLKTSYYNKLGSQASAGCIRLTCADAKWIYDNCKSGTVVKIFDGSSKDDPLGKPSAMKIPTSSPYAKWDPTDPISTNPWKKAKPTLTVTVPSKVELGKNVDLKSYVVAKDAYGVTLDVSINGDFNTRELGTYQVTYSTTDARGNSASASATITVVDTTAPTIKYTGVNEYKDDLSKAEQYIKDHIEINDLQAVTSSIEVSIDESSQRIIVSVTATDASSNKKTQTFEITIVTVEPEEPENPSPEETEDPTENTDTTNEGQE